MENKDKLVEIIQDHAAMEIGMRMILNVLDTKELPPQGILPTFNDLLSADILMDCLEKITGKKYAR